MILAQLLLAVPLASVHAVPLKTGEQASKCRELMLAYNAPKTKPDAKRCAEIDKALGTRGTVRIVYLPERKKLGCPGDPPKPPPAPESE